MSGCKVTTKEQLAGMIDHTFLKAYATDSDMKQLCDEAKEYGFAMVAVNSVQVKLCKKLLAGSAVHVGATISFPLGQTSIEAKVFEVEKAIEDGADEIDYVLNIGELKMGHDAYIKREMQEIVSVCRKHNILSKVIFENCYLTNDEIERASLIAKEVQPDYIKTSTGFGTGGATTEDVALMKTVVGDCVKVKASGGIRDWDTCCQMIETGADRVGTSASIKICQEFVMAQGRE